MPTAFCKPAKSHSLSICKGVKNDSITFLVDGEKIPLLAEHPVRSLGRFYTADLSDKQMAATVTSQLMDGLNKIDQSYLPGKFKVWCYQYTLYQQMMWPLKSSYHTLSQLPQHCGWMQKPKNSSANSLASLGAFPTWHCLAETH